MPDSRDAELRRIAAIVVDTDAGESPFAWSELPPPTWAPIEEPDPARSSSPRP